MTRILRKYDQQGHRSELEWRQPVYPPLVAEPTTLIDAHCLRVTQALRVMVVTSPPPPIKHSLCWNPDLLLLSTHRLPLGKALTILIHIDPVDGSDLVVWQAAIDYFGDVCIQVIHLL